VKAKKRVLIVTDGAEATQALARRIAKEAADSQVVVKAAADFVATDILPAEICFFGCEKANPPSFSHFEEVLHHINLAGRSCGLFSPNSAEAAAYLSGIVLDSELAVPAPPLISSPAARNISVWVKNIIK
jgi:hypothetical protein